MSTPTNEQPQGQPGRYQRSSSGLVGALLILGLLVGGFVVVQSVLGGDADHPVPSVAYAAVVRQARADHQLLVSAPDPLPSGWRATSVSYQNGVAPRWHLGLLTDQQKYVAIEESTESERALVDRVLTAEPRRGRTVRVGGQTWQIWTAGGDFALVRRTPTQTVLVGGSAGRSAVEKLAGGLSTGIVDASS